MKAKILWAEADRIHKMITKDLKEGDLHLNKKARIDVDKVPHSVIEYQDKNAMLMLVGAGLIIGYLGMMLIGDLVTGLIIMMAAILVPLRLGMSKKIIYPFFFAKWKSCTPFNMLKAKPSNVFTVKEKVETQKKMKNGKFKKAWKTVSTKVRKVGTLEFIEVKMQEEEGKDGIPMFTPESYELMNKNTSLREIIKGDAAPKTNLALMIIVLVLGVMIGYMIAPLIAQMMAEAAGSIAPAAAPTI